MVKIGITFDICFLIVWPLAYVGLCLLKPSVDLKPNILRRAKKLVKVFYMVTFSQTRAVSWHIQPSSLATLLLKTFPVLQTYLAVSRSAYPVAGRGSIMKKKHVLYRWFSFRSRDAFHSFVLIFQAVSVAMRSDDNVNTTWVKPRQKWIRIRNWWKGSLRIL